MAALATRDPATDVADRPAAEHSEAQRLFQPRPDGVSLEDRVLGVWEELAGDGRAECPVCGGRLHAASGCGDCGAELS
jgi:hypothetical protein